MMKSKEHYAKANPPRRIEANQANPSNKDNSLKTKPIPISCAHLTNRFVPY